MRWLVLVTCAACGRLGFDPTGDGGAPGPDASFAGRHVAYLKASNPGAGDNFGNGVALDAIGDRLAIGAWLQDGGATGVNGNQNDRSQADSGAAYTFTRSGETWAQDAYVKASNTGTDDHFGNFVALSADGTRLAVAAPQEASAAPGIDGNQLDDSAPGAGAAYVFDRNGATWSQTAYIKASNPDIDDTFGYELAISSDGNTLAIGAFFEQSAATGIGGNQADNSADKAGAVYVFTFDGAWTQQVYLKASNADAGDIFGEAVALSADGNTLAVGAPLESSASAGIDGDQGDNSASQAGAVYVFTRSGKTWSQQAYVKASNPDQFDQFGWGVTLSADGNVLAVGARGEASDAAGLGGDQVDNSDVGAGAAYVFHRAGTQWSQDEYVKPSNTQPGAQFGQVVALTPDGMRLIVDAPNEASDATGLDGNAADTSDPGAGALYLFDHSTGTWLPGTYIKQTNTDAGDQLAWAAITADSATIVIGAQTEDSSAAGIDGNQADNSLTDSGAAYIYY
ncbi:MAG TPA: hypothetical protein VGF94_20635 [Kofleriaceae bacterium]|jgi:hypothetical protein